MHPLSDSPDLIANPVAGNIEKLRALFPEAFSEGKVNFKILRQILGEFIDDGEEKYGLGWFGKHRARQLALSPSTGTLRPARGDSVDWDDTRNLMVEGDNLEVLKLLQKSYAGKVKLIYIDPPYNTGNDFVYPDDFKDNVRNYLEMTEQTEDGKKTSSNTESSGRFHANWLNMMYPRLRLAHQLLHEDGLLFISIDDHEAANLKRLCDEVFGEENFRNECIIRRGAKSVQAQFPTWDKLGSAFERILFYSKSADYRFPQQRRVLDERREGGWNNHWRGSDRPTMRYPLLGVTPSEGQWRWSRARSEIAVANYAAMLTTLDKPEPEIAQEEIDQYYNERIDEDLDFIRMSPQGNPEHYVPPSDSVLLNDMWADLPIGSSKEVQALFDGKKVFSNPKQTKLVSRMLDFVPDDAIVMDFFAGSGTTGHAVMARNAVDDGNRRYILVQFPEILNPEKKEQKAAAEICARLGKPCNIAEVTKERLRRASRKVHEENPLFAGDMGFRVLKLDTANFKAWEPDPENLEASLLAHIDHVKPDRSDADLLYDLLLKFGLDLTSSILTREIAGKMVHSVDGGRLFACLDGIIWSAEAESLGQGIVAWRTELAPDKDSLVVFRDSALTDDVAKANLNAILQQQGFDERRILTL